MKTISNPKSYIFKLLLCTSLFVSCSTNNDYYLIEVYQTTVDGDNLKLVSEKNELNPFKNKQSITLNLDQDERFQEYVGFGASFTESSAWNLATIPIAKRKEVLTKLFCPSEGAGFSLTRTHINSCDYSNHHYSYVDKDDENLSSFSVLEDIKGFNGKENSQVKNIDLVDQSYDLIPMILEASSISGAKFKIIASPWSPPSWMKENETSEMTNGSLKREYYSLWAKYLSMYVSAYKKQGIDIWGITPQNEPLHAHDARWDSNGFTAQEGRDFLRNHLGPQLVKDGHMNLEDLNEGLKVLIFDHNKSDMNDYVTETYKDPEASKYAWGTAFHWYASSKLKENNWYANELSKLNATWPEKGLIHTESSIDIDTEEPIGQYWRESTDYAGKFIPFETYVYDIISNLNHGTQGYVEWCMILSNEGKPNPYDNFNSAPVLINPRTDEIIYTPLYYLLSHFSKFIKPGAIRIGLESKIVDGLIHTAALNADGSIVLNIFNRNKENYEINIKLGVNKYQVDIGHQTLQTVLFKKKNQHQIE